MRIDNLPPLTEVPALVNQYFQKIIRWWNDHNDGIRTWDTVAVTKLLAIGTTTNDNATAGNLGEYVSASTASFTAGASTQWADVVSISLTAGDWDVSFICNQQPGSVASTQWQIGISSTAGNSATGLNTGDNVALGSPGPATGLNDTLMIPAFRVSQASTTTWYGKSNSTYTGTAPNLQGRISARRIR